MAKQRMVVTTLWRKSRKFKQCDSLERLLYLYLLTNEDTELCGAYEIDIDEIALHTGIDGRMLPQMFARLEEIGLAAYREGWVVLFAYKAMVDNPKVRKGIESGLADLPPEIAALLDCAVPSGPPSGRSVTAAQKQRVKDRDGGCVVCGTDDSLVVHHLQPVADGGTNADSNLVALCEQCHSRVHGGDSDSIDALKAYQSLSKRLPDSDSDSDSDSDVSRAVARVPQQSKVPEEPPALKDSLARYIDEAMRAVHPYENYGRERGQIKTIVARCRRRNPEDPQQVADAMLAMFAHLRENGSPFWQKQPFVPSALSSLWERIEQEGREVQAGIEQQAEFDRWVAQG